MKVQDANGNTLGFDEVVDTLDDALVVTEKVHAALADGIGLSDIGTLIDITPRLNEIRLDAETFAEQLADLTPDESEQVAAELVRRRGGSTDNIIQKALAGLTLASEWHVAVDRVVDLTQRTISWGKGLVKKSQEA